MKVGWRKGDYGIPLARIGACETPVMRRWIGWSRGWCALDGESYVPWDVAARCWNLTCIVCRVGCSSLAVVLFYWKGWPTSFYSFCYWVLNKYSFKFPSFKFFRRIECGN